MSENFFRNQMSMREHQSRDHRREAPAKRLSFMSKVHRLPLSTNDEKVYLVAVSISTVIAQFFKVA